MALTGRPGGPSLGPPAGLVPKLRAVGARLGEAASALGVSLAVDPLALLVERAAIAGLSRRGTTSCGGASRLLPCRDGWFVLSLARREDVALVPAWLERSDVPANPWDLISTMLATRPVDELLGRARLLGLPAARLPSATGRAHGLPVATLERAADPLTALAGVRVVELASLWAGPLCGSLLAAAGADVVKVESTGRPDGARSGPTAFFDLLNGGKRSVALDLTTAPGVDALRALVATADVVIEASRPRALEQLGIDATALVAGDGPRAWLSITGHGRTGPPREWVAFGDDAAVAGGLVAWDGAGPVFCADAIADPVTGVVAAVAVLEALAAGGHHLIDLSLATVAAHVAGPTRPVPSTVDAAQPVARQPPTSGPPLGHHTTEVLAALPR